MFGFFVGIVSVLGIVLATALMIFGVRTAMVGPELYKLIQKHRKSDTVLDLWIDYLRCKIDKDELHSGVTGYVNTL